MIPKWIDRSGKSDNYRALALYAADAKIGRTQGEKTFRHWYAGGEAASYLEGLIEVEATQAMNTTAKGEKTYHLMVSFRPEDEAKLTPQVLEEIETMLAEAIGFSGHQRHCGVHVNTNNMHLHVAYNMIEPRTFKKYVPYYDHRKLHQACRVIEQKFGLMVDKGLEPDAPIQDGRPKAKVQAIEAQTGQESFFSYVLRHKPEIMTGLEMAAAWPKVHQAFLKCGLTLKLSGNGLAITDRYGKHAAKASALDRILSKKNLEARFGSFQAPSPALLQIPAEDRFTAAPLHQGPERDQLYSIFQGKMAERKTRLEEISQESREAYEAARTKWRGKSEAVRRTPMMRVDRRRLLDELRKKERAELARLRAEATTKRQAVQAEMPYSSWSGFLRCQAERGQESALTVLRSKNVPAADSLESSTSLQPGHVEAGTPMVDSKTMIQESCGLSDNHRQALLAVIKMREAINADDPTGEKVKKLTYTIDGKGVIIFKLPDGGTIRDTGRELHFSVLDSKVKEIVEKYARARWGRTKSNGLGIESEYGGTTPGLITQNLAR